MKEIEIVRAIGAHGTCTAILGEIVKKGKIDCDADKIVSDARYNLRFLFESPNITEQDVEHVERVKTLYKNFYKLAYRAIDLALNGQQDLAKEMVGLRGDINKASVALVAELLKWKSELNQTA